MEKITTNIKDMGTISGLVYALSIYEYDVSNMYIMYTCMLCILLSLSLSLNLVSLSLSSLSSLSLSSPLPPSPSLSS